MKTMYSASSNATTARPMIVLRRDFGFSFRVSSIAVRLWVSVPLWWNSINEQSPQSHRVPQRHREKSLLLRYFHFRLEHHRCRAADAAVFSNAPEMHSHKYRRDQWNTDAVPDIRAQQRIRIHDRPA